jgi:hypothetical protein
VCEELSLLRQCRANKGARLAKVAAKVWGYQVMIERRSGQRFERSEYVLQRDSDNRLLEDVTDQRHVAEFLPNVRVDVCSNCNNGWMAAMEIAVRDRPAARWPGAGPLRITLFGSPSAFTCDKDSGGPRPGWRFRL